MKRSNNFSHRNWFQIISPFSLRTLIRSLIANNLSVEMEIDRRHEWYSKWQKKISYFFAISNAYDNEINLHLNRIPTIRATTLSVSFHRISHWKKSPFKFMRCTEKLVFPYQIWSYSSTRLSQACDQLLSNWNFTIAQIVAVIRSITKIKVFALIIVSAFN